MSINTSGASAVVDAARSLAEQTVRGGEMRRQHELETMQILGGIAKGVKAKMDENTSFEAMQGWADKLGLPADHPARKDRAVLQAAITEKLANDHDAQVQKDRMALKQADFAHDDSMAATSFANRGIERRATANEALGRDIAAGDAAAALAAPVTTPMSIMNGLPISVPMQATPADVLSRARSSPGTYGLSSIDAARQLVTPPPAPKPAPPAKIDPYSEEATQSKIRVAEASRPAAKAEKTDEQKIAYAVKLATALKGVRGAAADPNEVRRISSELTTKQGKIRLLDQLRAKMADPENAVSKAGYEQLAKELSGEISKLGNAKPGGAPFSGTKGAEEPAPAPADGADDGGFDEQLSTLTDDERAEYDAMDDAAKAQFRKDMGWEK